VRVLTHDWPPLDGFDEWRFSDVFIHNGEHPRFTDGMVEEPVIDPNYDLDRPYPGR
jgi:hypothetical protein